MANRFPFHKDKFLGEKMKNNKLVSFNAPFLGAMIVCCLLLASIGCGKNVAVKGKVVFPDGKPLDVGIVLFEGNGTVARGPLQSDGTFTLSMVKQRDGLPPGTYKVYISGAIRGEETGKNVKFDPDGSRPEGREILLIDRKLMSPETSTLSFEVSKSMKQPIEIPVTYPGK